MTFNGVPARFEIGAKTYITAEIPSGASSGKFEGHDTHWKAFEQLCISGNSIVGTFCEFGTDALTTMPALVAGIPSA